MSRDRPSGRMSLPDGFPRHIAFHSENGPGIGGSDLKMGVIADHLDRTAWEVYALVNSEYPLARVFGKLPQVIGDAIAASGQRVVPHTSPTTHPTKKSWKRVIGANIPIPIRRWLGYRRSARRVCRLLREHRIELFQTMDGGPQPTVVGARAANCRVVAHYAAPPGPRDDWIARRYARVSFANADIRVVASRFNARAWAEYLDVDVGQFRVVYNGVEVSELDTRRRSVARQLLDISDDAVVVGMTGRLNEEKGPVVFARALARLAETNPNMVPVFIGSGSEECNIRSALQGTSFAPTCRMLGFRSDAAALVAGFDVAVVPSVFPEPFGSVVIEAMAAGVPVVASNTGGIPEIVVDGESGILVPVNDDASLATAIGTLVKSPIRRRQVGENGFKHAKRLFTRERMLKEYYQMYEWLLPRNRMSKD